MTTISNSYLHQLSAFAAELDFDKAPAAVRQQLAWVLIDTVGAMLGGSAEPELVKLARQIGMGGPCSVVGTGLSASADSAALVNGTAGTFLEMDEGNRFSKGHPAVHVIPAALAWCEMQGSDATTFLSAILAGYEVGSRLGAACRLRGAMHPHGTWGTLGAAAACARIMGLSAAEMQEAINIAASMTTATSKKTMLQGGLVRNVYAGLSNRNGLLAVQLLGCGFNGEADGPDSLFGHIVSEHFDKAEVVRGLGFGDEAVWHITQNYFKLHSCCRFNHGTLDAIDAIAQQQGLPAFERIQSVRVDSYNMAAELHDPAPKNTLAAKFSVPFAVATRLVHGHSGLSSFSWDAVRDERVLALAKRVSVQEDTAMTKRLPQERPATVWITLDDGSVLRGDAGVNRGDDALPYSTDELQQKFLELSQRIWPQQHAQQMIELTLAMCHGDCTFADWVKHLRYAPTR